MSALHVPRRVPIPLLVATLWPTIILVVVELARELAVFRLDAPLPFLLVVWAVSTLPPALIAMWLVESSRKEAPAAESLTSALEALGRAERLAQQQAATLARVEAALAQRGPGDAAGPSGGARAGVVLVIALAFLLASAGLSVAFFAVPRPPEPVHIHATFAVFAEGERLFFTDAAFDLSQRGNLQGHLHSPDGDVLHIEGPEGAMLAQVLAWAVGARLEAASLALDDPVHQRRALAANATHPLRLFVASDGGDWSEVDAKAAYVPRDGDRILLTYGPLAPEELERQKSAVAPRYAAS